MSEQVSFQIRTLIERFPTGRATMGRLLEMQDLVDGQSSRLAKTFAALVALEGFLFGMNVAVVAQMVLPPKSFAANITAVRTFVRVRSLVDQQVVRLGELSIAELTNVAFFSRRRSRIRERRLPAAVCLRRRRRFRSPFPLVQRRCPWYGLNGRRLSDVCTTRRLNQC